MYSPAFSDETDSMLRVLNFFPLTVEILSVFVMVLLLCSQVKSMGRSPLWTVQVKEAVSSESTASSPKSKGSICGRARARKKRRHN